MITTNQAIFVFAVGLIFTFSFAIWAYFDLRK